MKVRDNKRAPNTTDRGLELAEQTGYCPSARLHTTDHATVERERWAQVAERMKERCADLCVSDKANADWHEGYRFALGEITVKLRRNVE